MCDKKIHKKKNNLPTVWNIVKSSINGSYYNYCISGGNTVVVVLVAISQVIVTPVLMIGLLEMEWENNNAKYLLYARRLENRVPCFPSMP